ncbi:MAG TPA: hypothetical protein VJN94_00090, partial [Candidatus Binataceae bacterium]|nr:hypothetical protein [Candidatus Binataceae bacterium]
NGREAAGYLLRAAAQAGRRFAYAEAVGYLDSALRQVDSLPEGAERDHLELELRGGLCGCLIPLKGTGVDISRDNLLRMCELSEKLGDADEHFWASFGLGFHYSMRLELDTARELGERQMSIAEDAHDPAKIAAACFALAQTLFMTGEFKAAYALAERALKLPPDLPKIPVGEIGDSRTMILTISASTLSVLGYPVRALERTREAVAVARQAGPYSLGLALTYATQIRQRLRDPEGVFEFADTLSLLCAKKGFSGWGTGATVMRCAGLVEQGRIEEALSAGEQIILKAEDGVLSTWRTVLIEAYTRQGRFAEASEQLEIAGRMARQHTLGTLTATLPLLEANLVVARDGADGEAAAERLLRHALEISQRQHAKLFELRAGVALARLWDGQGRGDDARAILAPIYGWFTEGFETVDLLEARELLGTLSGTGEMAAH